MGGKRQAGINKYVSGLRSGIPFNLTNYGFRSQDPAVQTRNTGVRAAQNRNAIGKTKRLKQFVCAVIYKGQALL